MADKKKKIKIGIFGYFGAWNLGDEAVVDVLIANLRKRFIEPEISAICLVPENASQYHKIPAFPLRRLPGDNIDAYAKPTNTDDGAVKSVISSVYGKLIRRLSVIAPKELIFLWRCYKKLKGYDIIAVGGSGQLIDNEGGVWNHPYNHFKWSILAKVVGARFVFLSVGAGPLNTRLGRWFIKESLSLARYRSLRDEYSKDIAVQIGTRGESHVFPDQAFSLDVSEIPSRPAADDGKPVVGIAPIAYCDPRHWSESKLETYRAYMAKIVTVIRWLTDKDYKIVLFHTQVNGDDRVIEEILLELRKNNFNKIETHISVHNVQWYTDALAAIGKTDIVIASRFHAVIFSYVMRRPVIGISYDPKIDNVMAAAGQSDYVLDIEKFSPEGLVEKFDRLSANAGECRKLIDRKVMEFRKLVQEQYDQVFREEDFK